LGAAGVRRLGRLLAAVALAPRLARTHDLVVMETRSGPGERRRTPRMTRPGGIRTIDRLIRRRSRTSPEASV
jgi:hypothetical protein